jgi:hypothetical protein
MTNSTPRWRLQVSRCQLDFEKIWEYCAQDVHKAPYATLKSDNQAAVRASARERFLSYALIKTGNSKHDKIKDDLSND